VLRHCELENSIVLGRSRLENLPNRIESSLIGRDVVVTASEARPRAHRLMLGDSSRVELA
jgi:glucose-1-phosphate thymidylyltransferase